MARPCAGFSLGEAVVNLSQFLPRLLPNVLGCPEPVAIQALLDSAIDFCNRSSVISVELDPITVIKDLDTYELETPDSTTVSVIQKVWYDGTLLSAVPYDAATGMYSGHHGDPRYYFGSYVEEAYSMTLMPTPTTTLRNGLRVRVALTPTRSATKVHSVLFDRYVDGIVAGAIAIIAAIPDQQYTNPGQAVAAAGKARAVSAIARGEIMHGNAQSSLSVKMRAF
jgi:hypothetical protein